MNMVIRAATLEDYEAVCVLFAQLEHIHAQALPRLFQSGEGPARSKEYLMQILANEDAAFFVAELEGNIVGMISCDVRTTPPFPLFVPRRFALLNNLVVSETSQGRGIGQALVEHVHAWARAKGATDVELNVWEFNTSARALYEKLGYQTSMRVMSKPLP